jgi:hypothetical protein
MIETRMDPCSRILLIEQTIGATSANANNRSGKAEARQPIPGARRIYALREYLT